MFEEKHSTDKLPMALPNRNRAAALRYVQVTSRLGKGDAKAFKPRPDGLCALWLDPCVDDSDARAAAAARRRFTKLYF
jgi:hypothetical protein